MTPNRARKTDTAKLLAEENISHREAAYKASNRTLMLPDGNIYDFSNGPLRFLGLPGNGQAEIIADAANEARSKGWIVTITVPGHHLQAALDETRPCLVVLNIQEEMGTAPHPLVEEIEAGNHRSRNIIILREPKPGEHRKAPAAGRNMLLSAETPEPRNVPALNNVALAKMRIAFARRFADLYASGADPATALDAVARDLDRFGTPEASAIAAAARSAVSPLRSGGNLAHEFKANHAELFGAHLVEIISSADLRGGLTNGLRNAAETLEADLRIGLIS